MPFVFQPLAVALERVVQRFQPISEPQRRYKFQPLQQEALVYHLAATYLQN